MDLETLRAQWSATVPPDYVRPEALDRCCLCVAPHKQHYVVRVVMWSSADRCLISNGSDCWNST